MGEKSFDHTKKYWFNKLRRQFPASPEARAEKVVIENPLAEQTITETLTEPAIANKPKPGFTPRFKAGPAAAKPAEPTGAQVPPAPESLKEGSSPAETPAKPGFKPRFKVGVTAAAKPQEATEQPKTADEKPAQPAKVGFTPRFKAGITKAAPVPDQSAEQPKENEATATGINEPVQKEELTELPPAMPGSEHEEKQETPAAPKIGFKPRFKPPQK